MSIKIFTIPFDKENEIFHEEILNSFILKNNIKSISCDFFCSCNNPYWTVLLEYEAILQTHEKEQIQKLDKPQSELLKNLFELRKNLASKDGIPVFIIATNKQLKDIVTSAPETIEQLKQVNGFGTKKIQKYGRQILDTLKAFHNKNSTPNDSKNKPVSDKPVSDKSVSKKNEIVP